MFLLLVLYRVANQVLMRPDEYKAVFRKAVFRWYTIYIIQAAYTAIDTDQLVKEINIVTCTCLLLNLKPLSPISRISCPLALLLIYSV